MTEAIKPKHPPELLAMWRREGVWAVIRDERWLLHREDLRRFCEAGWADVAYKLGWHPYDLYGFRVSKRPDGKLEIPHRGMIMRLNGDSVLGVDSDYFLVRRHKIKDTVRIRKPNDKVSAPA